MKNINQIYISYFIDFFNNKKVLLHMFAEHIINMIAK